MNTVVRELPPGKLARARSYKMRDVDRGSGYIGFTFGGTPSPRRRRCWNRRSLNDPVENRRNVATELGRIFAHWKMTELLHDDDLGALYARSGAQRIGGRTGKIILSGQQKQR